MGNNEKAYEAVIKMLSRREHSVLELRRKLYEKGFSKIEMDDAIARAQQQNYQSDARFAEIFVRSCVERGKGKHYIIQSLKQRGIDAADFSAIDFPALAKTVRCKKFGEALPENIAEKTKQIRFLQSRGFSFEEIGAIFKR